MDGIVKGLLDIALGGDRDDRRDQKQSPSESSVQQQSRSTWAEVVSGEQDNDGFSEEGHRRHGYDREENYGRDQQWGRPQEDENYERNQQWGRHQEEEDYGRSQQRRRPQEGYKRDEDESWPENKPSRYIEQVGGESNDGWETVQKKPPRHHKVPSDQRNNYKRPPEEQEYGIDVEYGIDLEPSHEELADISKACSKLWELDLNRLVPGKDYEIDVGDGKKVYDKGDRAEGSLFSWVNEDVFRRSTIGRFCSLLDNYNPHEGYKENVTDQEKQEQAAFIEEISRTAPIKYLHKYLAEKGKVSGSYQDFKGMMTSLWFDLYGRGGTYGSSSAFEHVFVGEIKQRGEQEVSGFHNWLQFYLEEAKGRVDYQGYIFPRRRGQIPDSETQLLTVQFEWNGVLKSVSSTLVGVSPEFEIALYTLCFFAGEEDNRVELGLFNVNVKCYRCGNKLGSAFPIAEC